jgi:hypothetical protein
MRALPNRARWFYERFCAEAKRDDLCDDDWVRFYRFVQACHEGSLGATQRDIAALLRQLGFSKKLVGQLRLGYFHGRRQLRSRAVLYYVRFWHEKGMVLPMPDLTRLGRGCRPPRRSGRP